MYDKEKIFSTVLFPSVLFWRQIHGWHIFMEKKSGENMKLSSYRKGFILWEILFFTVLFYFCHGAVYSCSMGFITKNILKMAAIELQSSVREAEIEAANSYDGDSWDMPSYRYFTCFMDHGQIRYYTRSGTKRLRPKGTLSYFLKIQPSFIEMGFQKNGRGGSREDFRFQVLTKDEKHAYEIIMAAATGRVRYEKIR